MLAPSLLREALSGSKKHKETAMVTRHIHAEQTKPLQERYGISISCPKPNHQIRPSRTPISRADRGTIWERRVLS